MSDREICDRAARKAVAENMRWRLSYRTFRTVEPTEILEFGIETSADQCARFLVENELGLAHAFARVHAELRASLLRLLNRRASRREAEQVSS